MPASAQAAGDLNSAIRVANSLFPSVGQRCGAVHVEIGALSALNLGASAESYFRSCRVRYAPATIPTATNPQLCSLTVHEWGHLAGLEHSPDPNNFMHERVPHNPACGPSDEQLMARQAREGERARRREAIEGKVAQLRAGLRATRRAHRRARGARRARLERRARRVSTRIKRLQAEYRSLAASRAT